MSREKERKKGGVSGKERERGERKGRSASEQRERGRSVMGRERKMEESEWRKRK